MQKYFLTSILCLLAASYAFPQGFNPYIYGDVSDRRQNTFRKILNQITLTAASGVGYTFYHHKLDGYSIVSDNDRLYINPNSTQDYYYRWLNDPVKASGIIPGSGDQSVVGGDSLDLGFRGVAAGAPLLLSLHYQFDRFRIGAGASFEFQRFRKMEPTFYAPSLGLYNESFSTVFTKLFVNAGVEFYRFYDWHYYLDIYAGAMNYGGGFNQSAMKAGGFFNIGVPIEREISEYFKIFFRPSWDFKKFNMSLPESALSIRNNSQALYLNIGVRMNYPDVPRCPIRSCETQKVHLHQGKEFRGRPFYKKQNPQIGENYKHSPLFKRKDKDAPKSKVSRKDPRK